ncbi:hypothetical protein X781_10770 [Mannheimia sp. USDA-ARS-USMARC-1261]|nr:hypothetical protein X781_10770 [Mannheimia sp. USDA-ARS-USMARC-1261]
MLLFAKKSVIKTACSAKSAISLEESADIVNRLRSNNSLFIVNKSFQKVKIAV